MLNSLGTFLAALPGLWILRRKDAGNSETKSKDEPAADAPDGLPASGEQQQQPAPTAAGSGTVKAVVGSLLLAGAQCAIGVGVLYLAQAAASAVTDPRRRSYKGAKQGKPNWGNSKAGGIPLAEVVRFRERQWFKDELEAAKQGDTGSMVRLAKLHLAGAGCNKDLDAAKYWVRRARQSGAWVSLEELIMDGPSPPPFKPPPGYLAAAARAMSASAAPQARAAAARA